MIAVMTGELDPALFKIKVEPCFPALIGTSAGELGSTLMGTSAGELGSTLTETGAGELVGSTLTETSEVDDFFRGGEDTGEVPEQDKIMY
jgi:hypothetical protein